MSASFFFYDLETTSVNPRTGRIMQFAGQRTDMDLNAIGEPYNILIKLSEDILPDPDAILITGITPQQTLQDGITEAEFLQVFFNEIATEDTIFTGYNTVRFDDEFMRYTLYRNFYDPYAWQWQDGRSRWDLLDVVRMTRALRPEGIDWPFDESGKPTNRLELITEANKLEHTAAHDALSDVRATINVARLLLNTQEKLFKYLLSMRDKQKVADLVQSGQPLVYTSGKYPFEYEKTSVVQAIARHPRKQAALMYDLRFDPEQYAELDAQQIVSAWSNYTKDAPRFPIKVMQYNRCPAVAPLGVLNDETVLERLSLDMKAIEAHRLKLRKLNKFSERLLEALGIMDDNMQAHQKPGDVETQLYEAFINDSDKNIMSVIRASEPQEVMQYTDKLRDKRLRTMLPRYKARNFPKSLTQEERTAWEAYRNNALLEGGNNSPIYKFFARLQELGVSPGITSQQQYLLEELQLYGQSIVPEEEV